MKIFINGFWGIHRTYEEEEKAPVSWLLISPAILVIISVLYGVGAELVYPYILEAAETLTNPSTYINAVMKE
jgi:multicomponent Na+:H+ antiporter subunit D